QDCNDSIDNDGDSLIDEDAVACSAVLTGTVKYQNGDVISGASVTVTDGDINATVATATSDSSGNFSVTLASGSNYTVTASYGVASDASASAPAVSAGTSVAMGSTLTVGQTAWAYCDSVIVSDCVQSVTGPGGAVPTSTLRLAPSLSGSSLTLDLLGVLGGKTNDDSGNRLRDLSPFGFSTSSSFTMKVLFNTFTPKGLFGMVDLTSWNFDSSSKVLTIVGKPTSASFPISPNQCSPSSCVTQADIDIGAVMAMMADDFSSAPASAADFINQFDGGYITTNANYFTAPLPDDSIANSLKFDVGAPHLKKSGVVNTGFFKLFIPSAVIEGKWGISALESSNFDVNVSSGSTTSASALTATPVSGGLVLENSNFEYSVNTFNVRPTESSDDGDDIEVEPEPALDTRGTVPLSEVKSLENALANVLGGEVQFVSNSIELIPGDELGSPLRVALPVIGPVGADTQGDLNFSVGNLSVVTVEGERTAAVDFGDGMTVTSSDVQVATEGAIFLDLGEPRLNFDPPPQAVSSSDAAWAVTHMGASFAMEFEALPDGARLDADFAQELENLITGPQDKLAQLGDSVGAEMGDIAADVAFAVSVVKSGITNADLGDTTVSLTVNKEWFDTKTAEGKTLFLAKFDDAGEPLPPPVEVTGSCFSSDDTSDDTVEAAGVTVVCAGSFTG
ncbi:MAG: hypothetical protein BZY88_12945, partial [SAR202 cluster bacterium Io17-Chloro-G9]